VATSPLNPTNSNSNVKIQDVVDEVAVIGDLTPVLKNSGGYADQPALSISNNVMAEMMAERFPWKWNRMKLPPFILTPLQQDYPSVNVAQIGWLENGVRIDINNTQVPPPSWPMTAVRDLAVDNSIGGFPGSFCWFPNDQLEYAAWPGPGVIYTNPVGLNITNENDQTAYMNQDGYILTLIQYGITGATEPPTPVWTQPPDPDAQEPPNWPIGETVVDGTTVWQICDPKAQGIRFTPRPPSGGNVWLCRLFAQRKARPRFVNLQQYIDPIPDDYAKWFIDGFMAYAHRYSSNPAVIARYKGMKLEWLEAMEAAAKQGGREDEAKGFFPDKPIQSPTYIQDQGPYPYRWQGGWA
jgi:hypothetical protein